MNETGTAKQVNNGSEEVMKIKLQFSLKEEQNLWQIISIKRGIATDNVQKNT